MKQILVATHNKGKLAEFASLLEPLGVAVISAEALALPEPDETASSFAGNARLKAVAAAKAANMPALADDSGISVAALDNGPGIFSSRYAAGDYASAFARIIAAAAQKDEWRARFTWHSPTARPRPISARRMG
jgi:XTP/dITP diphosphohydrolase